jgi:hypothetical protein
METKDRTYSDAIEAVLLDNGYVASLQTIYKEIVKYRDLTGKTPFATIQERVQRDKRFTRIEKGVYALTRFLDKLPVSLAAPKTDAQKSERIHFRMQGMLLEIGNGLSFRTFCANKKGEFAGKQLSRYATIDSLPPFTYPAIVVKASHVDVVWMVEENELFPTSFYEVDTAPSFQRSLLKFTDLRRFHADFFIVSDEKPRDYFNEEKKRNAFKPISERVKFRSYSNIEKMYISSISFNEQQEIFFR